MVRESIAILIIGVIIFFMFLRSKHYGYAMACLPVFIIPVLHLIIMGVLYFSRGAFFGLTPAVAVAATDGIALLASGVLIVVFSCGIQSKRNRTIYLAIMLVYTILLGWAYIYTTLGAMPM